MRQTNYYSQINPSELAILPPYTPPNRPRNVKNRGSVRLQANNQDVIFTGPLMEVVYSGCKYNSIVFVADQTQTEFLNWLESASKAVGVCIGKNPTNFKFTSPNPHEMSVTTPSSNPDLYPNELRCRLSTTRTGPDIDNQEITTIFRLTNDPNHSVSPADIRAHGIVRPIFKLGYFKLGESYGIELTLLKALYNPPADMSIPNEHYDFAMTQ